MSVLERLARISRARRPARRAERDRGQPRGDPRRGSRARRKRAGVVVDPPKPAGATAAPRRPPPELAELADDAARMRAGPEEPVLLPVAAPLTEAVAEHMRRARHRRVRPPQRGLARRARSSPRSASTTAATPASSAPPPWSWASTSATSTACSRPKRPTPSARSCSAWAGPAGAQGSVANTTFFCETAEGVLQAIALDRARQDGLGRVGRGRRPLLAGAGPPAARDVAAVRRRQPPTTRWEQLARVPDFRGIARDEFDAVIEHMLRDELLFESGGLVSMGETGRARVRPQELHGALRRLLQPQSSTRASTAGRARDRLARAGLRRPPRREMSAASCSAAAPGPSSTSTTRTAPSRVRPAPARHEAELGRLLPQFFGYRAVPARCPMCPQRRRYPYLHPEARDALAAQRAPEASPCAAPGSVVDCGIEGEVRFWTFAGGRINHTLKYILARVRGWKVVPATTFPASDASKATGVLPEASRNPGAPRTRTILGRPAIWHASRRPSRIPPEQVPARAPPRIRRGDGRRLPPRRPGHAGLRSARAPS